METLRHKLIPIFTAILVMLGGLHVTAGDGFALQQTDISAAKRAYSTTLQQRRSTVERLGSLEDRYRGLVEEIEKLRADGAIGTIGGRIELQNLLTKSKAIADELDALQAELRAVDNRLAGQRSTLVGGIDARLRELEGSLTRVPASSRGSIVQELNGLRRQRATYTTPLPSAPSSRDVRSALALAEDAAHPDELMAAADELQDTEDQLRKRLAAIESKLGELQDARRLARRARSFSREERFFEETDRDRVIARYERQQSAGTQSSGSQSSDDGAANKSGGGAAVEQEPTFDAAEDSTNGAAGDEFANNGFADGAGASPPLATDGDDDANFVADPTGGRATVSEPSLGDAPGSASVASGDPFTGPTQTIVIEDGVDPARAVGPTRRTHGGVEAEIQRLESERDRLSREAKKLRKRARELRTKAEQL